MKLQVFIETVRDQGTITSPGGRAKRSPTGTHRPGSISDQSGWYAAASPPTDSMPEGFGSRVGMVLVAVFFPPGGRGASPPSLPGCVEADALKSWLLGF